jgi:hypothetical protein
MRAMNHGSYWVAAPISASVSPSRIACAATRSRSGVARERAAISASRRLSGSGASSSPAISISSKPVRPVSSEQSAFCRLSWKLRPMAIASPTDFIAVVSSGFAPGNFSKAKRGILVTT